MPFFKIPFVAPKQELYPDFCKTLPSNLSGKVFAITGTTSGTGYVAAETVAKLGGTVLLLNRPSLRAQQALQSLQESVPRGSSTLVAIDCDLQDFASVRAAAQQITGRYDRLYCLCCNAGIIGKDEATKDGYDVTIQTDHFSHFLLAALLLDLLETEADSNGDARIVTHSSALRYKTPHQTLDPQYFTKKINAGSMGGDDMTFGYGCWLRHHQGKLANTVFTHGLHTKLRAGGTSHVRVMAAHPGLCRTNGPASCAADMTWTARLFYNLFLTIMAQSANDGTMGLLRAMVDPAAQSGRMYGPQGEALSGPAVEMELEDFEKDPSLVQMLWKASEAATGVQLAP